MIGLALLIAATLVATFALYKWMRAADALIDAQVRIVRLESRVLPDVPIYEQMREAL